jgi:hypothetical protein
MTNGVEPCGSSVQLLADILALVGDRIGFGTFASRVILYMGSSQVG